MRAALLDFLGSSCGGQCNSHSEAALTLPPKQHLPCTAQQVQTRKAYKQRRPSLALKNFPIKLQTPTSQTLKALFLLPSRSPKIISKLQGRFRKPTSSTTYQTSPCQLTAALRVAKDSSQGPYQPCPVLALLLPIARYRYASPG